MTNKNSTLNKTLFLIAHVFASIAIVSKFGVPMNQLFITWNALLALVFTSAFRYRITFNGE